MQVEQEMLPFKRSLLKWPLTLFRTSFLQSIVYNSPSILQSKKILSGVRIRAEIKVLLELSPWNNRTHGAQRLQAFAFCAANVNDEHTKSKFERKGCA